MFNLTDEFLWILTSSKCFLKNKKSKLKPFKRYASCSISIDKFNCYSYAILFKKFSNENNIMRVLNHEIMHIVLFGIEGEKACRKLDKLDNKLKAWYE